MFRLSYFFWFCGLKGHIWHLFSPLYIVEKRSSVTIVTVARTDGNVKIEPEFWSQNVPEIHSICGGSSPLGGCWLHCHIETVAVVALGVTLIWPQSNLLFQRNGTLVGHLLKARLLSQVAMLAYDTQHWIFGYNRCGSTIYQNTSCSEEVERVW